MTTPMVFDELPVKVKLPPIPDRIKMLPVDYRGYPIPWFVAMVTQGDGEPYSDFRMADVKKLSMAILQNLCWVCGQPTGKFKSFVLGPMCALNRNNAEPPCHKECATFSAMACPFITKPNMKRNEHDLPENMAAEAGIAIKRNPGCVCVWTTKSFTWFKHGGGALFTPGEPVSTEWYAEGRTATREEVLASVESGVPILLDMAAKDSNPEEALALLARMEADLQKHVPKA